MSNKGERFWRTDIHLTYDAPEALDRTSSKAGIYGFANWGAARTSYYATHFADNSGFAAVFTPKSAAGITVLDGDAQARTRQDIAERHGISLGQKLPAGALDQIDAAVGRTVVPLADYKGQYDNPVFIVSRPPEAGELKLLGPIKNFGPHGAELWAEQLEAQRPRRLVGGSAPSATACQARVSPNTSPS